MDQQFIIRSTDRTGTRYWAPLLVEKRDKDLSRSWTTNAAQAQRYSERMANQVADLLGEECPSRPLAVVPASGSAVGADVDHADADADAETCTDGK